MKHITIDNLEHIPESATFQDLRYLHGTGRSKTSIGAYGRKHSDYRFGAQTEIGDIEISVWEAAMHRLIRNSGEEALYQAISALSAEEQALVQGLIFEGMTEREYAEQMGVYRNAIHEKKVRAIKKIKKFIESWL